MWQIRLGLFLFCLAVLAVANIIYVVIETSKHHQKHAHPPSSLPDDTTFNRRLVDSTSILLQNTVQPCSDFYNYTCSSYGYLEDTLTQLRRANRRRVAWLMKTAKSNKDVSNFYSSCERYRTTESPASESTVLTSLLSSLSSSLRNYDDLAFMWGRLQLYDAITPLDFMMLKNPWDVRSVLPTFEQSGLFTHPSLIDSEEHRLEVRKRLSAFYQQDDADEWSRVIVDMEATLYSIFNTDGTTRDDTFLVYLRTHGQRDLLYDWQASIASNPIFNVTKYLLGCKPSSSSTLSTTISNEEWLQRLSSYPLWCRAQEYVSTLPSIIVKYPLQAWLAYTRYSVLLLNDVSVRDTEESMLATIMPMADYERYTSIDKSSIDCVSFTEEMMNDEVVKMFSDEYVKPVDVERAQQLAEHAKTQLTTLLHAHKDLQKKVQDLSLFVGYTGETKNRTWTMNANTLVDNYLRLRRERVVARLLGQRENPVVPLRTGARYRHQANALDISVALIQDPLINSTQTLAELYAHMTTIIGHELAHSIDMIGVNFNERGDYSPMSDATVETIHSACTCLLDVYERGVYTQNEDFADIVGVNLAFWSLMSEPKSNDQDRRSFFSSYAQRFCHRSPTNEERETFIRRSTHSLAEYRVNNVLQSNADFQAIYNCNISNACIKLF